MELLFLGTGTSQGVPTIGCECEVCGSTDVRDKRTRCSVVVRNAGQSVLIDASPDLRTQALREGLRWLDAVIFTHEHSDHVMGFDDLRRFCDLNGGSLPIYAPSATMERLRQSFDYAFDPENRVPGYLHPVAHLIEGIVRLGDFTFEPLPVPHGRFTTLGFLIAEKGKEKVAYMPDCSGVPDAVKNRIRGVPVLIIDGLRDRPHFSHLSIAQALEVAEEVEAGRTFLTHICHEVSHAKREATLPEGVRLAYDGLKLEL